MGTSGAQGQQKNPLHGLSKSEKNRIRKERKAAEEAAKKEEEEEERRLADKKKRERMQAKKNKELEGQIKTEVDFGRP